MRLALLSDTHGYHNMIKEIPDADVFIFAGDATQTGKEYEMIRFRDWLKTLPYNYMLILGGNHDFYLENTRRAHDFFCNSDRMIYIHEEEVIIDNVSFYGTSWQPEFFNWAFNRDENVLKSKFARIPKSTNVLITHAPPYQILDLAPPLLHIGRFTSENAGSKSLLDKILTLKKLKLHCFGHIHEARGEQYFNNIHFVNCSFNPNNPQIYVIEI